MERYYRILGLQPGASKQAIKKAYRRLVMQYHPDRNPSPEARKMFMMVDRAYDALYHNKLPRRKTVMRKKTWAEIFDRWKNVPNPPRNPRDYEQWRRVKIEQVRMRRKRKAKDYWAGVKARRLFLKKHYLYYPLMILFYIWCYLWFGVAASFVFIAIFIGFLTNSVVGFGFSVIFLASWSFMLAYRTHKFYKKNVAYFRNPKNKVKG